jgi:hypothetical protein
MSYTSSAVHNNNHNLFTSPTHLLKQVSHAAHGVSQLSSKMQTDGELSAVERSILEAHVALLQTKVFQLHGQLLVPMTANMSPDFSPRKPHAVVRMPATARRNSCSPPSSPPASASGSPQRRRTKRMFNNKACQHCDTQFTSQWRTGPSGPSTLCNACGIRYARQVRQDRAREAAAGGQGQRPREVGSTASPHQSPISDESPVTSPIVASSPPPSRASVHFILN